MTPPLSALLAPVGWTRSELARRLGCHPATVRRWGEPPPTDVAEWLVEVARALDAMPPPRRGWVLTGRR